MAVVHEGMIAARLGDGKAANGFGLPGRVRCPM
jgi:hypothetical protein